MDHSSQTYLFTISELSSMCKFCFIKFLSSLIIQINERFFFATLTSNFLKIQSSWVLDSNEERCFINSFWWSHLKNTLISFNEHNERSILSLSEEQYLISITYLLRSLFKQSGVSTQLVSDVSETVPASIIRG